MNLKAKWSTKDQITSGRLTAKQIGIYHFIQMSDIITAKEVMSVLKIRMCDIKGLIALNLIEALED